MAILKKLLVPAAALATVFAVTGCSNVAVDRANALQENLIAQSVKNEEGIQDFRLIGTEVDKVGFMFDVNFNGVAKLDDGRQAYTNFTYQVPSTYFEKLSKRSSVDAVYNVFDNIVENFDYTDCTINPVNNIKYVNSSFVNNAPSPFEKYNIKKGIVYNLSTPTFDEENKEISFDVKTLMDLRKTKLVASWGIGWNIFGMRFTLGTGVTLRACEGTFITDDTYKFTVDDQTFTQMQEDYSLAYTYVADAIQARDNEKISASRNTTNYATYDSADLLSSFDIGKVAEEYSK